MTTDEPTARPKPPDDAPKALSMPGRLTKVPFEPGMVAAVMVQAFNCGPGPWATPVTAWLKAPAGGGGAVDDLAREGNQIVLYLDAAGELVGVGSLGPGLLKWPTPKDKPVPVNTVFMLGVDARHQRKGYGREIMADMLAEAGRDAIRSVVSLCVDAENPAVQGLYAPLGFRVIGKPYTERDSGRSHVRMAVKLREPSSATG